MRKRAITRPTARGGKACPALSESRTCNSAACPIDCVTFDWFPWTPCSVTCGNGVQLRTRFVKVQPQYGGKPCGLIHDKRPCKLVECPKHCKLSQWTKWGVCTARCGGGISLRTRSILVHPQHGGIACSKKTDRRNCNTEHCPVACVHTWLPWSKCSKSCGIGSQSRQALVLVHAQGGGKECPAADERTCNSKACLTDCRTSNFSPWGKCSKSCGSQGQRERTRSVITLGQRGGRRCPALVVVGTCNLHACPIDCRVSRWTPWSRCLRTCGKGIQVRFRRAIHRPKFGGRLCPYLKEPRSCEP